MTMDSDRKKPIVTQAESASWVAPLPDDKKPVAKGTKLCVNCGGYHGSENVGFRCLESGIRALRAKLAERDAEIAGYKNVSRLNHMGRDASVDPSQPAAEPAKDPSP
jgi:hypothetical protein